MNLLWPLKEARSVAYSMIVGVWMIVAVYAVLHDQYLVRISPEGNYILPSPRWCLTEG